MSYASQRMVGQNNPTEQALTALELLMTDHPAWDFVNTFIDGTFTNRVWKCLGAQNGHGDFYVTFAYTTGQIATSQVWVQVSEDIDGTGQLIRAVPTTNTTIIPEGTYASPFGVSAFPASHANWNRTLTVSRMTFNTTDSTYWFVVTKRGIYFADVNELNGGLSIPVSFYVGLFEPTWPDNSQEFPLVQLKLGETDIDNGGGAPRRPGGAGASFTDTFAIQGDPAVRTYSVLVGSVPYVSGLHARAIGSRFYIAHPTVGNGNFRGLLYDGFVFSQDGAVSKGDTITVDGVPHVCVWDGGTIGVWARTDG